MLIPNEAAGRDKVVLQLKWEHEFQFAGFYAAQWQGYYAEEGLEVEIRSAFTPEGQFRSTARELENGNADFAIGALDILIEKDQGRDFIVLFPVFQKSAGAIFSLGSKPIKSLSDLVNLRIAVAKEDATYRELLALLKAEGFATDKLNIVDAPPNVKTLVEDKADAIMTYGVSAEYQAREMGINLFSIRPSDYGVVFYGDTLYTRRSLLEKKPGLVERFKRASLRGWRYALKNRKELVHEISERLPRHVIKYEDQKGYNQWFADHIDSYILYPVTNLGNSNMLRWERTYQLLSSSGSVSGNLDVSHLFYEDDGDRISSNVLYGIILAILVISLAYFYLKGQGSWIVIIACSTLVLVVTVLFERDYIKRTLEQRKVDTLSRLSLVRAGLEGQLTSNLAYLYGLAAFIEQSPELQREQFDRFVKPVMEKEDLLLNMAAAPDMVVRYVYPLRGNESVIGLDYNKNKEQRAVVMLLKRTGRLMIAGPVNLVQGGTALIGRVPVYYDDNGEHKFWGVVSSPIRLEQLYEKIGLYESAEDIDVAIRGRDGQGASGEVFYGNGDVFYDNPVLMSVNIEGNQYQLAARPRGGWASNIQYIWAIRTTGGTVAFFFILFLTIHHSNRIRQKQMGLALRESEDLLSRVGQLASIGGARIDFDKQVIRVDSRLLDTLQVDTHKKTPTLEELISNLSEKSKEEFNQAFSKAIELGESFELELDGTNKNGKKLWFYVLGERGALEETSPFITCAFQDVTEKKEAADFIEYQASYDQLTGLANRVLFNRQLQGAVDRAYRDNSKMALLFLDLDNFKPVNDSLGHHVGDKLLIQVAGRLESAVRKTDIIARLSGDEFAVILSEIDRFSSAYKVAENIIECISTPFQIEDSNIHISASIGISLYPEDASEPETLLKNADHAMYVAKESGRNCWQYFTEEMQRATEHRQKMHSELIRDLSDNKLMVFYQPIIDLDTGLLVKCEALIRWNSDVFGFVSPEIFISLAEDTGLINKIGKFVVQRVCEDFKQINAGRTRPISVTINVSPRELLAKDKDHDQWYSSLVELKQYSEVTLEITENLFVQDAKSSYDLLTEVKERGISLAIDDFGTGYSSLSYLTRFPVDILKIDRAFIKGLAINRDEQTLVDTILIMASRLGIEVVAEGVETKEQADYLKNHLCDYAQGYYYSKPVECKEIMKIIDNKFA
ncbi:EAL domain-containing protein [Pleionea sp. CnH1-48]|uniref:EAL domain-containing protein n=1 Tax=Pleionea sp. CnH1-48 TaxID=2954494 RepID=UPI0020969533|nr:EAL domain-containing protein [Pleionea sp. CnH1-48]